MPETDSSVFHLVKHQAKIRSETAKIETDAAVHIANVNQVLEARGPELWGKHVAWSDDGTQALAIAETMEALDAEIARQGLADDDYVLGRVPTPEELWMFPDDFPQTEDVSTTSEGKKAG